MAKRGNDKSNAPGKGNKTPADVEAIFAAEYLRTGIAAVAARKAKISRFTGCEIARRLDARPEFAQRRTALFTRGLDEVEAALLDGVETARKRIKAKPIITEMGVSDNGPHWMRALVDLHRSLVGRRKIDHDIAPENKPQWPAGLRVIFDDSSNPSGPPTESDPCPT